MTVGPGEDSPDAYEAANGMEAATPGQPDNPGTRDPSATTPAEAFTNAMAASQFQWHDISPLGAEAGTEVALPDPYTPNEGV